MFIWYTSTTWGPHPLHHIHHMMIPHHMDLFNLVHLGPPSTDRQADICENITFQQTMYAGGKNADESNLAAAVERI